MRTQRRFHLHFSQIGLIAVSLSLICSPLLAQQSQSSASSTVTTQRAVQNPNQIAILRWYPANQAATFAVGAGPGQIAFDGSNMWVTNSSANTVTKLQASDGKSLGNFPA